MPFLEAQITTEKASRYLVQFCRHAAAMGSHAHTPLTHLHGKTRTELDVTAERSPTNGTVTFGPWGRCTLTADANTLTLNIDAPDETGLSQIRDIVTRDFERFLHKTPTPIIWHRPDPSRAAAHPIVGAKPTPHSANPTLGHTHLKFSRRGTVLLVIAVVAIAGVHLGLAGTLIARSPWTGMATNLLLALVVLKVALIVLARVRFRRAKAARVSNGNT